MPAQTKETIRLDSPIDTQPDEATIRRSERVRMALIVVYVNVAISVIWHFLGVSAGYACWCVFSIAVTLYYFYAKAKMS